MKATLECFCGHSSAEHALDGTCMIIGCECPTALPPDEGFVDELDGENYPDVPTCCVCGCTEAEPCEGGCSWVILDSETNLGVCSACADAYG